MRRTPIRLISLLFVIIGLSISLVPLRASGTGTACAVTPDKLDGQGLNVSGLGLNVSGLGLNVSGLGLNVSGLGLNVSGLGLNVSGLSLEQIVKDIWTNPVTPAWLTQLLPGVEGGAGYNTVPAAILIVDDFGTPTSHGYDVRKVFDDLVAAINAVRDPDPVIALVNVDISGANYDSMLIATNIRNTVNGLLPNYQHFAVNMSFGLVPCDDPVGTTITDAESGATFTMTKAFSFSQMQTAMASKPVVNKAAIYPVLECVVDRGHNKFTAYFGYRSDNTTSITIPVGERNHFHPWPKGQGQPSVFMPGRQEYVFKSDFGGFGLLWKVYGPDNKLRYAEASRYSKRCVGTPTLKTIQAGLNGYGGLTQYAQTMGIPDKFVDDYLEYLSNKGATMDDPLNGLRPLLNGYLVRSAQEAADGNPATRFALIPIASSGNFRPSLGPTPLAPARFTEVIAVSATLGTFGNLWVLSHDGNVRAPGAGYILAKDASGGVTRVGAGTSFAAPYVSTLAALWLTYPNACQFGTGTVPLLPAAAPKNTNAVVGIAGTSTIPLACSKNTPPVLSLASGLTINEGQSLPLGTVSDPDGDAVTVTASLGTVINTSGSLTFSHNDGPLTGQSVIITATDARGGQTTATFALTVNNVAPTAQLTATPQTLIAGGSSTLALISPVDPSTVDTTAGFSYAFDCGTGAGVISTVSTASMACSYPTAGSFTARGLIRDKDGGISEYSLAISVNPAPTTSVCYATSVVSYAPGKQKNGSAVISSRRDASKALGAPQKNDTENFVSLGFGDLTTTGIIVLDFAPKTIQNGTGLDLRVWETSFGDSSKAWSKYPEAVKVFASQDNATWVYLGKTSDKDQAYDLGSLTWARYIKLVDASDRSKFGSSDDGFDVDGIEAFACQTPAPGSEARLAPEVTPTPVTPTPAEVTPVPVTPTEVTPVATTEVTPVTPTEAPVVDTDGDTVPDATDNCPTVQTTDTTDSDGDGVGNACDDTPNGVVPPTVDPCTVDSTDTDADGTTNACDSDDDGDGLLDADESTLYLTNPLLADTDADGVTDGAEVANGTNPLEANAPAGS